MTPIASGKVPANYILAGFRRVSVSTYHHMIEVGDVTEDDPFELLEGYLVMKMPRNPAHDASIRRIARKIYPTLPPGWEPSVQCAVTLSDSEPEPDYAVIRTAADDYAQRHPGPAEIGILVEISYSSLPLDRVEKTRIYARAGISCYWIVNLIDRQVEVCTSPSGPTDAPAYAHRQDYLPGDSVPLVLDGAQVALIPVVDCLP